MAKVGKVKKKEPSVHSRAARRGAEPVGKDLAVKGPVETTEYKPWLHNAQSAGIQKKKKTKQLSRQQKERREKALEKADVIVGKHEKKVADSKRRGKKVQARSADWEELNGKSSEVGKKVPEAADEAKMEDAPLPDLEQPLVVTTADQVYAAAGVQVSLSDDDEVL
ncbi:hypothetical protein EJ03DRAFT_352850 [Teratosphaeria nubilosa]|uniref:Uncharacterized protein n=1 Tax=Teratosphaeria nubilosa TaxID=161662 RepID=A0A6G1L4M0_9PEZI|nr:hypothetical protein EJ03DRAFT_352850 [Teratosphaeria nubilosa]